MSPLLPDRTPGPLTRRSVRGVARRDGTPVRLAVAEVGDPDAPALVLGHGVGSSARFVVAACAAPVVAAGWRLVAFDQRGHGASTACPDVADHHLDVHAGDLVRVAADVPGPVVAVGGVSLGGHAAVRAALEAPRVVCLPAWSGPSVLGEGPHAAVAAEVRTTGVAAVTDRLAGDVQMPRWLRDTLVTDYRRHDAGSLRAALLALDGGDAPTDAEVAAVGQPVAVVGWPDDPGHPLAVAERWARLARRGTLTTASLTDPEIDLTRFGAVVVRAARTVTDAR